MYTHERELEKEAYHFRGRSLSERYNQDLQNKTPKASHKIGSRLFPERVRLPSESALLIPHAWLRSLRAPAAHCSFFPTATRSSKTDRFKRTPEPISSPKKWRYFRVNGEEGGKVTRTGTPPLRYGFVYPERQCENACVCDNARTTCMNDKRCEPRSHLFVSFIFSIFLGDLGSKKKKKTRNFRPIHALKFLYRFQSHTHLYHDPVFFQQVISWSLPVLVDG